MARDSTRYFVAKVALSESEEAEICEAADADGRAKADFMRRAALAAARAWKRGLNDAA